MHRIQNLHRSQQVTIIIYMARKVHTAYMLLKLIVNISPLPFSPFGALDAVNASKSMKI